MNFINRKQINSGSLKLKTIIAGIGIFLILSLSGCSKFLDEKPNTSLAIPSTVEDLEMLLDNYAEINSFYPGLSEVLSDNYYLTETSFLNLSDPIQRLSYYWSPTDLATSVWQRAYKQVLTTNIVLDNVDKVATGIQNIDTKGLNAVKGSALFLRSYYFFSIAQLFAKPYLNHTSGNELGIVLRLNADFNTPSYRATLSETYSRIISDLKISVDLLPEKPLIKTRPSKAAAYGALAKVYLSLQKYDSAGYFADQCLKLQDTLMNFNLLNKNAAAPIKRFNAEVVFHIRSSQNAATAPAVAKIDSSLMLSYANGDLRKSVFYRLNTDGKTYRFKGDYDGSGTSSGYVFAGIVTDEMYLIRAEAKARLNHIGEAMLDLNKLVLSRWDQNIVFTPIEAIDVTDAVTKILIERRKELLFRGTRWTDLRRLQNDTPFEVIPTRIINNEIVELPINSVKYVFQIPRDVILQSGIPQNPK